MNHSCKDSKATVKSQLLRYLSDDLDSAKFCNFCNVLLWVHPENRLLNTVGHQPQQMALPSCVRSEDEAVENREKTTRRDERRWFGSSRPKHEMKRRDDLKDDIRC
ncbi:hypothetical protein AVEN_157183-1 [Araneus ventricosus]|uniref:Uncharacterized protein n=1 Tax=Araneus ventricosus TaxID=182803 RepID=A0A4Y2IWH1_ARAVE|nr:hypothetical protein AVEN_157183-1 [Araneus ventricosus]